jgi:hypothetical protein
VDGVLSESQKVGEVGIEVVDVAVVVAVAVAMAVTVSVAVSIAVAIAVGVVVGGSVAQLITFCPSADRVGAEAVVAEAVMVVENEFGSLASEFRVAIEVAEEVAVPWASASNAS